LRPEWLKVSLASGCLASTCDTAVANMFYSEEEDWRPLRALAREVLHTSSDAARPKVATSGSRPVSYLSPGLAGELLGLAILRRDPWPALKRHGVESNRVAGRWSGVSKARFDTMAKTLEEALSYDEAAALGLWLRVAWEKARSRKDLLDFYDGLREAGLDARRSDVTDAQFLCDTAAPPLGGENKDDDALARLLLQATRTKRPDDDGDDSFAAVVEAAVVALSASGRLARRPRSIRTVNYGDAAPKPDCVEVCVREVVDLLSRLETEEDESSSEEWFARCQGVDESAEYLSATPDGRPYELAPSKRNVAVVASQLLYGERCETFEALAARFNNNASRSGPPLAVVDRSAAYRPRFSESLKVREIADLVLGPRTLEIHLEREPPVALATHRSAGANEAVAAAHVDAFFEAAAASSKTFGGDAGNNGKEGILRSLWLHGVLADRALEDDRVLGAPEEAQRHACLAARFAAHDAGRWSPLTSDGPQSNDAHDHAASLEAHRRRHARRGLRVRDLRRPLPCSLRSVSE